MKNNIITIFFVLCCPCLSFSNSEFMEITFKKFTLVMTCEDEIIGEKLEKIILKTYTDSEPTDAYVANPYFLIRGEGDKQNVYIPSSLNCIIVKEKH